MSGRAPSRRGLFRCSWFLRAEVFFPLLLIAAVAGPLAAPLRAAEKKQPARKHFLWKVQSGKATVYLLGSIHVGKKDLYPLPEVMETAFRESDHVVFELPMDTKSQLAAALKFAKAGQLPAGDTLEKHLDAETRKLLSRYFKASKIPLERLQGYRPWLVAVLIMQLEMPRHGYSSEYGIDHYYQKKAVRAGKPAQGLETYDDQINIFASLPEKTQLLFLKETLQDVQKLGTMLDGLFASWKAGDAEKLDFVQFRTLRTKEYRPLYEKLIVARNRRWMKQLEAYLKTGSTFFVVVGAGHLVGKDGLVEMLRAKKFHVTRL